MNKKQKLELTWIGKENRPRLEPRILLEDPAKSYHAAHRVGDGDVFDNKLIFGDNLLALKALEQEFTGKIKCIYVDPPFNTQQAFEHYDDTTEHSDWLRLMRDRLEYLRRLLANDGTLFVHIDDNELGYLIVLLDEIFGRNNRLYIVTFKQASATGHKSINPGCVSTTNFLLIYAKDKEAWTPNRIFTARERDERYGQFIENIDEPFSKWRITTLMKAFAAARRIPEKAARAEVKAKPELLDDFVVENARSVIQPAEPNYEGVGAETRKLIDQSESQPDQILRLQREGYSDIYLKGGKRILFYSDKLKNIDGKLVAGEPLTTLWDDILSNNLHAEGGVAFPKGKKPEALIKRIFELATKPGDWVLDSFAGSGTTGAVAHKMRRRWIMAELEETCHTHIIPRMNRVIDGSDTSGVTEAVGWKGGGGFRYYRLAPSLLEKDKWGNWVISKEFNAAMLAEAVCKLEGFQYAPSDSVYWQHGHSTERDFIYVTTANLNHEQLQALSDEVGGQRSLLVVCSAFDDISYDNQADLLYDLAGQMVAHLQGYLKDTGEVENVLQYYHRQLAEFIHAQMQGHHWEKTGGHDVVVSKGFTALKPLAFTVADGDTIHDFRTPVADKSKIAQMVFGGFKKCLYPVQKFQSDPERVLSIVCDRESEKWFRPGRGQFQIFYKWGSDPREYQPDFVAETKKCIYMLEPKMRKEMEDDEVRAKKDSAVEYCQHATDHSAKNGGKPWKYLLIPHDAIAENMTIEGLSAQFAAKAK